MWLCSALVLALFGSATACYALVVNTSGKHPLLAHEGHVIPHAVYEASMYVPFSRPPAPEPHSTPAWPHDHWSTASPFEPTHQSSAPTPSLIPTPPPQDDLATALQVAVYQADLQLRCTCLLLIKAIEMLTMTLMQVAVLQHAISEVPAMGWRSAGMEYTDQVQLQWMAQTSQAHRTLLAHLLTSRAPPQPVPHPCTYAFPPYTHQLNF